MQRIAFLLLLSAAPAAAQERPAEFLRLPAPSGAAALVRPEAGGAVPLVILLPDALGLGRGAELYVNSLLARGIASLQLGLGEDTESPEAAKDPAAEPEAVAPALAWARGAGFGPAGIGVLGFGRGGRAALAGAGSLPAAALYPGCTGLPKPGGGPRLVLQGAEEAEGCAEAAGTPGMTIALLPGAGHAWDAPGAIWPSPGPVLPDPAGQGRRRARTDPEVTRDAAEKIAAWFERLFAGAAEQVSR